MISSAQHLLAEKQAVEQFLSHVPEEHVLQRNSFLARLDVLNAQIEAATRRTEPARSVITYRGRPVFGSHGIASTFGLQATRAYTNVVQQVAAQWNRAVPLGTKGQVPGSRQFDPLITGTALGSFGFEVEEQIEDQLTLEGRSVVALALGKTNQLLQGTLGSDDELTEAVSDVDPRAIAALRTFLKVLANNEATCAIESDEGRFHFETTDQVARSLKRLDANNIRREETVLLGAFQGVLPTLRTFEFQTEGGEVVSGKVTPALENIEAFNDHLRIKASLKVISNRVGNGRARYILIEQPQWLSS